MHRFVLGLTALSLGAAWLAVSQPSAPVNPVVAGLEIGPPIRAGNLTVFPVLSRTPRMTDRYITLDEGLRTGTVEVAEMGATGEGATNESPNQPGTPDQPSDPFSDIVVANENPFGESVDDTDMTEPPEEVATNDDENPTEPELTIVDVDGHELQVDVSNWNDVGQLGGIGGGAEVNRLLVRNTSGKPLYLMPGEVVVGGQQDRTIAEPTVIASADEWVPIDAFCVEHGRWAARSAEQTAALVVSLDESIAEDVATDQLAAKANRGRFIVSNANLNASLRSTVLAGKGQQAVWDQVDVQNAASMVADGNATAAFTANYASDEIRERLVDYEGRLRETVANTDRIVGVVVAINGEVRASDVFESTPLFRKLWPKLLKSYALDATVATGESDVRTYACSTTKACSFVRRAYAGSAKETGRGQGVDLHERSNDGVVSYEHHLDVHDPEAAASLGGGLGGSFGGAPVQASAFAK